MKHTKVKTTLFLAILMIGLGTLALSYTISTTSVSEHTGAFSVQGPRLEPNYPDSTGGGDDIILFPVGLEPNYPD